MIKVWLSLSNLDSSIHQLKALQIWQSSGRLHTTVVAYLLLTQQPWVQIPAFQKFFHRKHY